MRHSASFTEPIYLNYEENRKKGCGVAPCSHYIEETKPAVWYFVIADCEKNTFDHAGKDDHHPITVRLDMLNDGSYFSEEETGLLPLLALVGVAIIAMLFVNAFYL